MGGKLFNMKRMSKEQYNNVISELEYLFLELKFNPHFPVVLSDKEKELWSIEEILNVLRIGKINGNV